MLASSNGKDALKFSFMTGVASGSDHGGKADQSRNAALEFGSVAYYEKQMQDSNKPLLDENKKQTRELEDLNRNVRQLHTENALPGVLIA